MNHDSQKSDEASDRPSLVVAHSSSCCVGCVRSRRDRADADEAVEVGTTAATEKMPKERKRCLGVRSETEARLAKANGGDA